MHDAVHAECYNNTVTGESQTMRCGTCENLETMKNYDIALSFAGEDRQYARELAQLLDARGVKVFFDEFEEHELWGQNLYSHLCEIYQNRSQYVVIFISEAYKRKLWTKVEREAAQAKAFTKPDPYILPIRLDDSQIEGILPTVGYVNWFSKGAKAVADMLLSKLGRATNPMDEAEMVRIPEGEFIMGSNKKPKNRNPEHVVRLDSFYIYKYPVTLKQFRNFCRATGYGWHGEHGFECRPKDNHPAVCVSWHDAVAYCDWAGVTLPTEAQWEKAARGTDARRFPWGNEWDEGRCEYRRLMWGVAGYPVEVGSFPRGTSPYGVEEMCGNIWEWCADWYDPDYYANSPRENPKGPESGEHRVKRGCGWQDQIEWFQLNFECSFRDHREPGFTYRLVGFRCVK